MSLGEEIIEPFYRDPGHSEGDFFQFYYQPFLHIAIFTINSTERCFLVYNLYDKCIKWFQTHLLFKLILACKISSQTPVMNFLHDGVHISYIRIHVRYVPLYLHKTCQVYKLKIRFNTLSENRNYNWNSDTSYHSDIITCQDETVVHFSVMYRQVYELL